jgi:hypothetical protein
VRPCKKKEKKVFSMAGLQWLIPVILAMWEAEISRMAVSGLPRPTVHETSSPK